MPASSLAASRLVSETVQIATSTPIVMALRLTQMGLAGNNPSASDRREFHLMSTEKLAAFQESWLAMATKAFEVNQQFANAWMRSMMTPWWLPRPEIASFAKDWTEASMAVLGHGAAPVRRRAVANVRRLMAAGLR